MSMRALLPACPVPRLACGCVKGAPNKSAIKKFDENHWFLFFDVFISAPTTIYALKNLLFLSKFIFLNYEVQISGFVCNGKAINRCHALANWRTLFVELYGFVKNNQVIQ